MFKIDYYIFKYFLTSKMAGYTKICLMVINGSPFLYRIV
jgi:hypothetical protein